MKCNIFFSWQSDISENKDFIRKALGTLKNTFIGKLEIEITESTSNVSGSPDIPQTIFNKIINCNLFIADVTITNKNCNQCRHTPNPNVLLELGFARGKLGDSHIIMLYNEEYGKAEEMPFDFNHSRLNSFNIKSDKKIVDNIKTTLQILLENNDLFCTPFQKSIDLLAQKLLKNTQIIYKAWIESRNISDREIATLAPITDSEINLYSNFMEMEILEPKELEALTILLNSFKYLTRENFNSIKSQILDVCIEPLYIEYAHNMDKLSLEAAFNEDFIEMFNKLSCNLKQTYINSKKINNKTIFCNNDKNFVLYDKQGKRILQGSYNVLKQFTGYKNDKQYDGYYKNGKRHGKGKEKTCDKTAPDNVYTIEGEWFEGKFISGIIHSVLCKKENNILIPEFIDEELCYSGKNSIIDGFINNIISNYNPYFNTFQTTDNITIEYYLAECKFENGNCNIDENSVISLKEKAESLIWEKEGNSIIGRTKTIKDIKIRP